MKLRMKTAIVFGILLATLPTHGIVSASANEPTGIAKVMAASETTTFNGKRVTEDSVIEKLGVLKTGSEGGAKIRFSENGIVFELAANTEMKIILPESGNVSEAAEIVAGSVRILAPTSIQANSGKSASPTPSTQTPSPKKTDEAGKSGKKPNFTLRSKTVTMGVRGTEFLAVINPALDEAELVVFKGVVEFTPLLAPKDAKTLEAGYWTGLGGRFGKKAQTPIRLSKSAIEHFDRASRGTPSYTLRKTEQSPTPSLPTSSSGNSKDSTVGH
jgi:hypothetical protein